MSDRGMFVTLKKDGEIRGCIGNITGRDALFLATVKTTLNSALHDSRFTPIIQEELSSLRIEISVLTPSAQVDAPEDFIVGRHGIILEKGRKQAVFLPQVAIEQGWDREQTLTQLALKAGLPPDAWKTGAEFFVFEAQAFSEE